MTKTAPVEIVRRRVAIDFDPVPAGPWYPPANHALETVLNDEANTPNTLGDLIYWACRAESGASREYICDSLDLAQQFVLRPWGRLAAHCKQNPVPAGVMQKGLRELKSTTGRLEAELLQLGSPLAGKPALARAKELRHLAQVRHSQSQL